MRMFDTNDPTIGTKLTCLARSARKAKRSEIPTVAPNAQKTPPMKLFIIISFTVSFFVVLSRGCSGLILISMQ